jgi:predicted DsbA family dithiol-disulfide isomerase
MEERGAAAPGAAAAWLRESRIAFFVRNENIARRDVQEACAVQLGLPWAEVAASLDDGTAIARVWSSHEERQRLGIQGSPSWVMDGGRAVLYGNVNESVLQATIEALLRGQDAGASRC